MAHDDRNWMRLPRSSDEWQKKFKEYLNSIFEGTYQGETAACPCPDCRNMLFESRIIVQKHVINRGFDESFIKGEGIGDYEEEDNNGVLEQTGDGAGINEMLSTLIKGAIHGFNPFGMLNITYTTWPVILIPYNLPPWLCLKQSYWMMSMLIPGPKSPGMNIDVYLEPLVDELKQLWIHGVKAWDAKVKRNFTLRAILLWTINDFPAYAMLSGWSTKGKFACPYCHKDTEYLWLKFGCKHCYLGHRRWLTPNHKWRRNKISFNNKVETREAPIPLTGAQVLQQYDSFEQVTFGKMSKKRKQRDEETRWHNWRKKSIFFELPYWKDLLVRHNLDVMHIEKNICDSILGTLLDIEGKSKDSVKARLDMQNLGIRKDQHPIIKNDKYSLPASMYSLGKEQKAFLCKFLEGVKMPDGYASNIRRCVNMKECKVSGLKTHDCHVIFQKLLPIAIRDILPDDVVIPLIELSRFFNAICSKELSMDDLESMSKSIGETLCRLEMVFPPAFFDIMMHLPVHLAEEAKLGGPVCYRWMYPVERYLRTLKGYVRNKSHPEGSIAEGYISEECMTFCSRFLEDVDTKFNRPERHESAAVVEPPSELSILARLTTIRKELLSRHFQQRQEEESCHLQFEDDEEEDDTYIDDGHVAPAVSAYVTQDDNLIGTVTAKETISYSARLCLPDKMPMKEKQALVEGTIIEMGLQDCANSVISNWHLRGISGGEKRRVSIALEILMRPRLLFLDDHTRVWQVMAGPSSHESISRAFFAQAGFPCPLMRNPSDHFLRCINSDFDKVKATLKGSMKMRYYMNAQQKVDEMARLPSSSAALENCRYCCCEQPSSGDSTVAGQYQNNLKGLVFDNQNDELPKISGDYILEKVF
ncbi:hypothetical protein U9M48_029427 [Paspalum notatum var. saurae]|uniref:Transposase n=1 Tax=Paspalum notatum var. saurae TaxID=547442 RepID=A0AAQ3TYL0_PASNO